MRAIAVLLMIPLAAATSLLAVASSHASHAPSPPIASNVGDVVGATVSSGALVGGVGFVWRAMLRFKGPAAGLAAAKRWGGVSAGFAGGRALGQLMTGDDGTFCQVLAAVGGGAVAACDANMSKENEDLK